MRVRLTCPVTIGQRFIVRRSFVVERAVSSVERPGLYNSNMQTGSSAHLDLTVYITY